MLEPIFSKRFDLKNVDNLQHSFWNTQSTTFVTSKIDTKERILKNPLLKQENEVNGYEGLKRLKNERIERDYKKSIAAQLKGDTDPEIKTYTWQ
jgi:hypothetical protein